MNIGPVRIIGGKVNPSIGQASLEDDDFGMRARQINLDLSEADTINITIKMIDGSVGQVSIKATTIAQIIIDRNAKAAPVQDSESTVTEIQVGDGDISDTPVIPLKIVSADEILAASLRARTNIRQSPH